MSDKQDMNFEESLGRLQEIVEKLEDGDLSLDESLVFFTEGVELIRVCNKKLEESRGLVEKLIDLKNGVTATIPMDES